MKRLLSAALAIVMLVTAFPVAIFAATPTPAAANNTNVMTNNNHEGGVVLNKMAVPHIGSDGKPDGTIDITLEAYTTGVVTNTIKVTPTDIVLVLDMSGSMESGGSYETVYSYTPVIGTDYSYRVWEGGFLNGKWVYYDAYGFENEDATYYIKVGNQYQSVTHSSRDDGSFDFYYYGTRNNRTYVYPKLDSEPTDATREHNYAVVEFYARTASQVQTSKSRIDMLKEAVNTFIDETAKSNEGLNASDMHSISIVKFAMPSYGNGIGNSFDSDGYNHSQVVAGLTTVNEDGATTLKSIVEQLEPSGATAVDYGINLASQVLTGASASAPNYNRKQVVIVFTDGEPNYYSGYDQEVAAAAVTGAKALKDIGVTIFSVCVADGADATASLTNSNTDLNKFMHYVSSNFPKATVTGNNVLDDGIDNSEVAAAMAKGYYHTPDTTHGLASIFESIAQTIETPTIEVGESATLVDTISPYFTMPADTNSIEILTAKKTATGWENPVDASGDVTYTVQNDRTIAVSGFDFDENYVSAEARDGFYGKMLVLTFNISPDYNALDNIASTIEANGGMISTNQGNASLNDSSMKAVAEVGSPTLKANKVTYMADGAVYKVVYRFAGADVTLIDEPADTAALDYGTWESDDVTIVNGGFEMPEEDVIINVTSTRKSYKVTYRYSGAVPAGTPAAPAEETFVNGATVKVKDPVSVTGYDFVGWTTVSTTVSGGEFTMPAHDVEFIGYFNAGIVTYKVEHYLQNADGSWPTDPATTHTHDGKTGTTVTAHKDIVYPNFELDLTHDGTVIEGPVASDSSLVLKLYYKRIQKEVTYEYTGTVPKKAPAVPAPEKHYYGSDVVLKGVPNVPGYTFIGWATDGADVIILDGTNGKYFTMPGRNVVVRGTFIPNSGTGYKVEHWLEGENEVYSLEGITSHTGTTGATANAVPGSYPGYSHNPNHPDKLESDIIAGDGSLVLRVYYSRDPYKVKYEISGNIKPADLTLPATKEYDWGTDVKLEDVLAVDGYVFYGWYTDDVTIAGDTFEMPAYDVTFVGYFVKETATYTIEHYLMDPNGNYPTYPIESYDRTGNVGDNVTAEYIGTFLNLIPDTDHPDTKLDGTIASNKDGGKLVLKLYYERKVNKVTYQYTGTVPADAPALPEEMKYYAGATVDVKDIPTLAGYTFNGWISSDVSIVNGQFKMPNTDVVITGYFDANEGTKYVVQHWVQTSTDDVYELRITTSHTGETDTTATAVYENFHGYEHNTTHDDTLVSDKIKGDGSLVLKLYYDRLSYNVSYTIVGGVVPEGVTPPDDWEYVWGTTVDVEDVFNIADYTFIGWDTSSATVVDGKFEMPAHDVQFTGRFVINTAKYKVEHYLQNADGSWPTTATYSYTNTVEIGRRVYAREDVKYPNFTLDIYRNGTLKEGTVLSDGSLVLKLFYVRNKHTVKYDYIGDEPDGAPALPLDDKYYYNEEVTLASVPTLSGYTFIGWSTDGADVIIMTKGNDKYIVMPNRDVTIKGTFLANEDTVYTVQHWLEDTNGYKLVDTIERTGETGKRVNAMPGNYVGYTHNPNHSDAEESGVILGDGSLVLRVYYNKTPYNVYYSISGDKPDGATAPESEVHDYTDAVTVKDYKHIDGYRFIGWTTTDVTVDANNSFSMPAHNVYFSGYYVKTIAGYTVEHYLQNKDGTWPSVAEKSYSIMGDIGSTVSADYLTFVGFTPARTQEGTLVSGEVNADGTLVLKLYYARNMYKVTYTYTSAPAGAPELPKEATYYFDSSVEVAGVPSISGYTFYGWTTTDADVFGDEFTMPDGDVVFTGYFVAGPSKYTVEHYKQNIDGTYNETPDDSEVFTDGVKVGDYVVAQFKSYEGFTPKANQVYSGIVTAEPDTLTIKLYYTRNSYNVSYVYFGTQPEGAPDVSVNNLVNVKYGEKVDIAAVPALTDYAFNGWNSMTARLEDGYFYMPANDVTLYGNFVLVKATYRVEHYLQNTDGTWADTTPYFDIIGGTIGETATATYKEFTGFTADKAHGNTVVSGTVDEAGTLVLKLYYARNTYKVTYAYESAPEGAPALPAPEYVYYGTTVKLAAEPEMDYYVFSGWKTSDVTVNGGEFEMPNNDVLIKGSFTQTEFVYTVRYYVDNSLYASYEVYSGDVHTIIAKPNYPAPMKFTGWFEPTNVSTGKTVPTSNGTFVMPESDVEIHGKLDVNFPSDGRITIEKVLEAPNGFTVRYFNFAIYREVGTRVTFVKNVTVKAGEKISIPLDAGVYYVYEEGAEVDGYTLFTTTNIEDNRIVVKPGRSSVVTFKNSYYPNILVKDDHFAYIIGYPDGLVRPEANITRAEVATIFFRMLTDEARATYWSRTNSFSDVSSDDWFNNAVSTLAKAGVLNGYEDGTFRPNAYITRAELVKIAVSFFGTSAGQNTHFADASDHWASDFVAAAEEFGFIDGYEDGTFRPDRFVTRAEAMKVINRTLGRNPHKDHLLSGMITWADNTPDKWYYADVQEATNSHTYHINTDKFEVWEALLPVRDWAAFEREWSTANAD